MHFLFYFIGMYLMLIIFLLVYVSNVHLLRFYLINKSRYEWCAIYCNCPNNHAEIDGESYVDIRNREHPVLTNKLYLVTKHQFPTRAEHLAPPGAGWQMVFCH